MAYRRVAVAGTICGVLAFGCLISGTHAQEQSLVWERRLPGGEWPERAFGLFTDPIADQLVVFGQGAASEVAIWTWDEVGGRWTRRAQPTSAPWPANRSGAAMARDSQRPVVVMFGGSRNTSAVESSTFDDLWQWSFESQSWTRVDWSSARRPAGRSHGAMAFDESRGVLVLFGGETFPMGDRMSDLWEWTPATGAWTEIPRTAAAAIWPPALQRPDIAFDPSRSRIVLVGTDPSSITGNGARQVWEWDGMAWTVSAPVPETAAPAGWLPARLVFDPTRARVLALGSKVDPPMRMQSGLLVWEWRSLENTWALLPLDPVPSPTTARIDTTPGYLAYDRARDRIVTFGSIIGMVQINELLELDLATGAWRNRTPVWPENGHDACALYDPIRHVTVLFGGTTSFGGFPTTTIFEWDGNTGSWRNRAPAAPPVSWPLDRGAPAMVYDTLHEGALMFGGVVAGLTPINDLWIWNGDSGQWTEILRDDAAVPWPAARTDHAMAWDSTRNVLVLHGGMSSQNRRLADTWEWDGATSVWTNRTVTPSPSARAGHTMYYDAGRRKTVLFGGTTDTGEDAELWEWNGDDGTWTPPNQAPTSGSRPRARYDHAMVFDPHRNTGVLFGGAWIDDSIGLTGALSDVWEWDGRTATFANRTPSNRPAESWPPARTAMAMTYDSDRKRLVLIGGLPNVHALPVESFRAPVWEAAWGPSTDVPPDPPGDAGCGCAAAASSGPSPAVVLLMLLAIGFRSRRRARVVRAACAALVFGCLIVGGRAHGQSPTWERRMPGGQWPDKTFGLFADPTADRLVAFGQALSGEVAVWIWEEARAAWTRPAPPPSAPWPTDRAGAAMAHDSRRGTIVMFGGFTSTDFIQTPSPDDFWEWSLESQAWTPVNVGAGRRPPSRCCAAMTFDENRGVTLLFGGRTPDVSLSDFWEWNPATGMWTELLGPQGGIWPSLLGRPDIAFDPSRSRIILVGSTYDSAMGASGAQVWQWGGTAWTIESRIPAEVGPEASSPTRLVFDRAGTRMLALGTEIDRSTFFNRGLRLWEWRPTESVWALLPGTPLGVTGLNMSSYEPGYLAHDARHNRIVTLGGMASGAEVNDLVELDLAAGTWRNRTPAWPDGSYGQSAAYDPIRRVTVLFGGMRFASGISTAATFEWDGHVGAWRDRTPAVLPAAWPLGRSSGAMVYDTLHQAMLLFGGSIDGGAGAINDLWLWDGASGQWSEISREDAAIPWPVGRNGHAMVWDEARERLVVHGGASAAGTPIGDTWEWNAATSVWINRSVTPSPSARAGHAMYYDVRRRRSMLFGGLTEAGDSDEIWEWDGDAGAWTQLDYSTQQVERPRARHGHAMVFDTGRNVGVLFGGAWTDFISGNSGSLSDVWEWGATFLDRTPSMPPARAWPSSRSSAPMVYDSDRKRLVLFGGLPDLSVGAVEPLRASIWEASLGIPTDAGCECATTASGGPSSAVVFLMLLAISCRSRRGPCRSRSRRSRPRSQAPRPDSCSSRPASP